ncbi:hypothetical protein AB0J52_30145, partial [Spirillospora sp. NPDC049652]
ADPLAVPRLTVRASTAPSTFARVVEGRGVPLVFLKDHVLTRGYAVVRRTRYGVRLVRSGVRARPRTAAAGPGREERP